jgi:type III secretion protein U
MSEKTEPPTPRRLREARRQGQVPRSRLFSSAAASLGGLGGALLAAPGAWVRLKGWIAWLWVQQAFSPGPALARAGALLLAFTAPALLGALGAALLASLVTAGLRFEPGVLVPRLERIGLGAGLARLLAPGRLAEVGKGLLVLAVLGTVALPGARPWAPALLRAVGGEGGAALDVALVGLEQVGLRCAAALALLGLADLLLARRRHLRSLRMSREEVKREHKESEGDPRLKGKRRALHRQLVGGGVARGVRRATAVVVNPTHLAVALRYDPAESEAPYLVARGREADARALRREAVRLGIPVVRDVPLARSLIHYDVGEELPEELYQAAAAVLRVALGAGGADGRPGRGPP